MVEASMMIKLNKDSGIVWDPTLVEEHKNMRKRFDSKGPDDPSRLL
jgi:hypothetical protein